MSVLLYKPNSKNTGAAFTFQGGIDHKSEEQVLYIKSVKQHSWDADKKKGYFQQNAKDPEKNIISKFNEFEIGSLISAINGRREYSTFHSYGDDKTSIKFLPWDKPTTISSFNSSTNKYEQKKVTIPAFGLTLTKNGSNSFKIALEPGECECLKVLFQTILTNIYNSRIDKQLAFIKEAAKAQSKEFI